VAIGVDDADLKSGVGVKADLDRCRRRGGLRFHRCLQPNRLKTLGSRRKDIDAAGKPVQLEPSGGVRRGSCPVGFSAAKVGLDLRAGNRLASPVEDDTRETEPSLEFQSHGAIWDRRRDGEGTKRRKITWNASGERELTLGSPQQVGQAFGVGIGRRRKKPLGTAQ